MKTSPAQVQALECKYITQVQCGCQHTMALTSSGYVFTWGILSHSIGCTIPSLVEGLRDHNVVQITTCERQSAVLVDPTNPSTIRQSQQASFNNQQNSDVVFKVENERIYAIVDILSQRSDYFAAMFRSNMRERLERVVEVPSCCSKVAFVHILKYLCLDDFSVCVEDIVEVWVLADMYQLEGLKLTCMGSLERGLCKESASDILEQADDLSCPCDGLKRLCEAYLSEAE